LAIPGSALVGFNMKAKGLRGQGNGLSQKLALRKDLAAERKPTKSLCSLRALWQKNPLYLRVFAP
jgi:hypothetical protein